MGYYDWGNPPITSTLVTPVASPDTTTVIVELDSTMLGSVNFAASQTKLFKGVVSLGSSTTTLWNLEHSTGTAAGSAVNTLMFYTAANQSAAYPFGFNVAKDGRIRVRVFAASTNCVATIQVEAVT